MGWEVLSEGTPLLTPASVSKIVSGINNVLKDWFKHLPHDIISDILFRLPLKHIVRCTSVCKSLETLINHPTFMLNHLTHKGKINDHNSAHLMLLHLMFHHGPGQNIGKVHIQNHVGEAYSLQYDNKGFHVYCNVDHPIGLKIIKSMDSFTIVGSCNGLFCLADEMGMYDGNFALWNPSVRRYMILPKPSIRFSTHGLYDFTMGVGYDVKSNDYKIVRVVTLVQQADFPTVAQVYSLARGTWGEVHTDLPPCSIALRPLKMPRKSKVRHVGFGYLGNKGQAFVNGVVPLMLFRRIGDANNYCVLTFDVSSEAFGEIMFPKRHSDDQLDLRFSATGDGKSIALFVKNKSDEFLDIWVMKEYGVQNSWAKLVILTPHGPDWRSLPGVVCFRKSGELLLVLEDRGELYAFDIINKQFKLLGAFEHQISFCTAYPYEESLVLLDRKDATSY